MEIKVQNLFQRKLVWERGGDPVCPYQLRTPTGDYRIRVNAFPDRTLYTLLVNGVETAHFDDWPRRWIRP
jgi:hypothetical protein